MPLPEKREGETEFERRIRHHMSHLDKHPGGQDQAIAIAAEESGVAKKSSDKDDEDWDVFGLLKEGMSDKKKSDLCQHGELSKMCKKCGTSKSTTIQALDILKACKGCNKAAPMAPKPVVSPTPSSPTPKPSFSGGSSIGSDIATNAPAGVAYGAHNIAGKVTDAATSGVQKPFSGTAPKPPATPKAPTLKSTDTDEEEKRFEELDGAMKKALPRQGATPFYLRSNTYDSNDIMRSATQQTSRMYTALAPAVEQTIQDVQNKPQTPIAYKSCAAHGMLYKSEECPACVESARMVLCGIKPITRLR